MVLYNGDWHTQRAAYQSNHAAKQCNKLERQIAADRARCENGMATLQRRIDENHRLAQAAKAATTKADADTVDAVASLPAARARLEPRGRELAEARAVHAEARVALDRVEGDRREVERAAAEIPGLTKAARALALRAEADAVGAEAAFNRLVAALEVAAPDHPLVRDREGAMAGLAGRARAAYDRVASRHGLATRGQAGRTTGNEAGQAP